jgi:death-on-curing protein
MTGIRYLTHVQLLTIAEHALDGQPLIRDRGLLASASERPGTSMVGTDLYPTLLDKAAALLHSIARFHPLVDGNKRLAWLATYTFVTLNGAHVVATNDEAFELTIAVATGQLNEVADIAKALGPLVRLPDGDGDPA